MEDLSQHVGEIEESFQRVARELGDELDSGRDDSIGTLVREMGYGDDLVQIRARINSLVEEILSRLAALKMRIRDSSDLRTRIRDSSVGDLQEEIMTLQSLLSRLVSLADQVDAYLTKIAAHGTQRDDVFTRMWNTCKNTMNSLINWLKGICAQLWQLLCRLLTPKEWKLSGEVKTPVFNLGKVGIEITFG